jgi:hypothetical protein
MTKQPATVKSRIFTGEDTLDLDIQIRHWCLENPEIKLLNQHPDERIPLKFDLREWVQVLVADDRVMRQVDYEVIVY